PLVLGTGGGSGAGEDNAYPLRPLVRQEEPAIRRGFRRWGAEGMGSGRATRDRSPFEQGAYRERDPAADAGRCLAVVLPTRDRRREGCRNVCQTARRRSANQRDLGLPMDVLTATAFRAVPPEVPLAMPVQSLRVAPSHPGRPASSPRAIGLRRLLVIGGAIAMTGAAEWQMKLVLAVNGLTPLAVVMLALFAALFAWIALSFTSAIAGFVSLLAGGGRRLGIGTGPPPPPTTRIALLMPCYNESPVRVMAGVPAILGMVR